MHLKSDLLKVCHESGLFRIKKRRWTLLFYAIDGAFKADEAELLNYLIGKQTYFYNNDTDNDGWFYCKRSTMTREIGISKNIQARLLKKLKKKGFLDTKFVGIRTRRYIKIHTSKIADFIEEQDNK